jgi:energy-coupling factor transport system permease protein
VAEGTRDARAWIAWAGAAGVLAMLTRNPLYALLLILIARLVDAACGRPERGLALPWARLALAVLPLSTLFNALFVHTGETVLGRLPAGWPLIGGIVTLEALIYGFTTGLILLALLAIFVAFNHIVPIGDLVRLAPRAYHDLGVVMLVAVTYVPETARHLSQIREAQAVRGRQIRGLRDWRPLLVPLLVGGMERAMGLAEAMVARGYGATSSRAQQPGMLLGLVLGLLLLLSGWLLALWQGAAGWLLFLAGALLLGALLWRQGRTVDHTHYRPHPWRRADTLLVLLALLALGFALWQRESLTGYTPYPRAQLPPFSPLTGAALLLLALPALLWPQPQTGRLP